MLSFSAMLLAGGQSTRMGRDKALLPLQGSDLLLWQRQLRVLEELGPEKMFWSGALREGIPAHLQVVRDAAQNVGPMAGIGACLDVLTSDLLVVVAIDLPQMKAAFLQGLLARCSTGGGVVARHGDFFEPLAAVYPKRIASLARKHLEEGRYAMQELIREAVKQEILQAVSVKEEELMLFKNLNTPADLH
jgi:molybdopterin-guanine dinucleotide biosynthesis protein A